MNDYLTDLESVPITEAVRKFHDMVKESIKKDREIKAMNKRVNSANQYIAQRMVDEGIDKLVIDGVEYKPNEDLDFSIDKALLDVRIWDNPVFFSFLREIGEGDIIQIKETVNHQTRKSVLKKILEDQTVKLPNYIKVKPVLLTKFSKKAIERKIEGNGSQEESSDFPY